MDQIQGRTVKRPVKAELAGHIASEVGVTTPAVSRGSSVAGSFLSDLSLAIGGSDLSGRDTYRKTENVLQRLGLTYDPWWDTSEAAKDGGGTVTTRAYSRILAAVTGTPRCFIVNTTDHPVSAKYADSHESSYNYDSKVTGHKGLNDAGPGSRVVYYTTSNASTNPKSFTAHATVDYISPGWDGPWEAHLRDYESFRYEVPRDHVRVDGWNSQNSIVEITWGTYAAIVNAGGRDAMTAMRTPLDGQQSVRLAERVRASYPPPTNRSHSFKGRADVIPSEGPAGTIATDEPHTRQYDDERPSVGPDRGVEAASKSGGASQGALDKETEQRAVEIATAYLSSEGWTIERDCQTEGTGFDFVFSNGTRELHVEVKGIRGHSLAFNLTPKEWWRARTDHMFIVIAVTNALSPANYYVNVISRERLCATPRVITGYRMELRDDRPLP